jgi:choline dehydrogenase-like flavoprotein
MRTIAIVGAGTAGCVVARHLADATRNATEATRIILIERGGVNPHHDAADFMLSLDQRDHAVTHVDARITENTKDVAYPYVQAHCVGGGGAVNGMVVSPLHIEDFENWRDEYGCTDWNFASVIQSVGKLYESYEIDVADVGVVGSALLGAGARPATLTWTHGRVSGASLIQEHLANGVNANGVIELQHANVTGLVIDNGGVQGVQTTAGMIAADLVVMATGSIITPLLLSESGFTHTHLGNHAQDHPSVFFTVQRPTPHAGGFNATALCSMGDTQLIAYESANAQTPMLGGISLSVLKVRSRGRVTGTSQSPQIDLQLLSNPEDLAIMRNAVREFVHSTVPVIEKQCGKVMCDSLGSSARSLALQDDRGLDEWLYANVVPHSHVAGTCAMGEGPQAVVSQRGHVLGVQGLYVADASVFPQIPRSNTNMVVAAVALQIARFITEDLS